MQTGSFDPRAATRALFAQRLREALAEKYMTQEGLARKIDVSKGAVDNWVGAKNEPQRRQLVAIAAALDRDPAWFYAERDQAAA